MHDLFSEGYLSVIKEPYYNAAHYSILKVVLVQNS
jgi:hypothetical protein